MFKSLKAKAVAALVLAKAVVLGTAVTVMANPVTAPSIDIGEAIGSGMTAMVGEIFGVIAVIVPIALGLVGVVIAIQKGISLMRSMTR